MERRAWPAGRAPERRHAARRTERVAQLAIVAQPSCVLPTTPVSTRLALRTLMSGTDTRAKAALARILRPFAKVHPEEAITAVLSSLQDTTRNALFLLASRPEKFVGKTAIDTVAVRTGAMLSTLMVFIGTRLGWSTATLATINVGLVVVWIGFVLLVRREHLRRGALDPRELAREPRHRATVGEEPAALAAS